MKSSLSAFILVALVVGISGIGEDYYYYTTHSFNIEIDPKFVSFEDPEILEWHFHVYWHQTYEPAFKEAMKLRDLLLDAVSRREFIVIFPGITDKIIPGLNDSRVPRVNTQPVGPHPGGSFEVWTPKEYFNQAMSFFLLNRGELTILLHPLTQHQFEDHTGRAVWLGPPFPIVLSPVLLIEEGKPRTYSQYPELGLGYATLRKHSSCKSCSEFGT